MEQLLSFQSVGEVAEQYVQDVRNWDVVKRELFLYRDEVVMLPPGKVVKITLELVEEAECSK